MDQTYNIIIFTILVPILTNMFKSWVEAIGAWAKGTLSNGTLRKTYVRVLIYEQSTSTKTRARGSQSEVMSIVSYLRIKGFETNHYVNFADTSLLFPVGIIDFPGIRITCDYKTISLGDGVKDTFKMTLRSYVSNKTISDFIEEVKTTATKNKIAHSKEYRYFYKYLSIDSKYRRYPLTNPISLKDLYLPNIETVIGLVEKYKQKQLSRLVILLHGEPGVGKTTFIKALSTYLKAHVVDLDLNEITSDDCLMERLYSVDIPIVDGYQLHVPLKKRIYVIEDIDALNDIVLARSAVNKKPNKSKEIESPVFPGVTLSGLLNALDGIVELQSVVVITTNHVEKLDPALIRPGRIDISIHAGKLSAANAQKMIIAAGFKSMPIADGKFTVAQLSQFTKIAQSNEHLAKLLC